MTRDGGPAFPPFHDPKNHDSGISMRDWFAGQASEEDIERYQDWTDRALTADYDSTWDDPLEEIPQYTREQARYRYADAMLRAREENNYD